MISNHFKAVGSTPDNTALSFALFNYLKRAVILCCGLYCAENVLQKIYFLCATILA
ncbi:MAG: hypothetical protein IT497_05725 [Ottowia sp.]|nr:hypothetical protein [Ottowia sp.]